MSCRYVCCYLASQADPRRFKRVTPFCVSTAVWDKVMYKSEWNRLLLIAVTYQLYEEFTQE